MRHQASPERVDDIPLLLYQMMRMGVPRLLDKHFVSHGNLQGRVTCATKQVHWRQVRGYAGRLARMQQERRPLA